MGKGLRVRPDLLLLPAPPGVHGHDGGEVPQLQPLQHLQLPVTGVPPPGQQLFQLVPCQQRQLPGRHLLHGTDEKPGAGGPLVRVQQQVVGAQGGAADLRRQGRQGQGQVHHHACRVQPVGPAPPVPPEEQPVDGGPLSGGLEHRRQGSVLQEHAPERGAVLHPGVDFAVAVEQLAAVQVDQQRRVFPLLDVHHPHGGIVFGAPQHLYHLIALADQNAVHGSPLLVPVSYFFLKEKVSKRTLAPGTVLCRSQVSARWRW